MKILHCFIIVLLLCGACTTPKPQQAKQQQLQKIFYSSEDEIQRLRNAGAEIIVKESDYVIVRTDSMLNAQSFSFEPIQESDLVQRLIKIIVKDSTDKCAIANVGIDIWEVKADTIIARAYDNYIEQLKNAGLSVQIIATNAANLKENK